MGLLAMLGKVIKREEPVRQAVVEEVEDPVSLLRRKVLCALEYTGNYQEVLMESGKIIEVEKMQKFAKDRVRDALVHAGFAVPPLGEAKNIWGNACFDAVGVNSKYLVVGEVKWGEEVTEKEIESLMERAREAEKRKRGRELVLFVASLRKLREEVKQSVQRYPKSFVVSFEEVRPYQL
ncbi:MAG: hypothetical protein QXF56_02720 [Candidatus Micrarchaeia archaeon]